MSHAVSWFQIQGPNAHALQKFYKDVFGWKMKPQPGDGDAMMVAAEPDGIAGSVGTSHNHQPSVAVHITVGDIDAVNGKIERAGGRMVLPKTKLPRGMGWMAAFVDPAGNWTGLWMKGKPAAKPKRSAARKAMSPKKTAKKAATRAAKAPSKKVAAKRAARAKPKKK